MAMYVAKNGVDFEIVVKGKNDPRFEFLLPHHVHYQYYSFKKEIHMRVRFTFLNSVSSILLRTVNNSFLSVIVQLDSLFSHINHESTIFGMVTQIMHF